MQSLTLKNIHYNQTRRSHARQGFTAQENARN